MPRAIWDGGWKREEQEWGESERYFGQSPRGADDAPPGADRRWSRFAGCILWRTIKRGMIGCCPLLPRTLKRTVTLSLLKGCRRKHLPRWRPRLRRMRLFSLLLLLLLARDSVGCAGSWMPRRESRLPTALACGLPYCARCVRKTGGVAKTWRRGASSASGGLFMALRGAQGRMRRTAADTG